MKNLSNLGFVVLLIAVVGCSCPKLNELIKEVNTSSTPSSTPTVSNSQSNTTNSSNSAVAPKTSNDVLTMDTYNQIKDKTPRADVEKMLGGKGTEVSSQTGGGQTFTVVKWEGDKFKTIIITFQNDKVMSKSQYGLQ